MRILKKYGNKIAIWLLILIFAYIYIIIPLFDHKSLTSAGYTLLVLTILGLISFIFLVYCGLRLIKKMKDISINELFVYSAVIFLFIITFFAYIYIILINLDQGSLIYTNNQDYFVINKDNSDFFKNVLYFSGTVFFSSGLGDIVPTGYAKLTFIVETYIGIFSFMVLIGMGLFIIQKKLSNTNAKRTN